MKRAPSGPLSCVLLVMALVTLDWISSASVLVGAKALASTAGDAEAPLEDPALKPPVYWLGDTFAPANGLPPLSLAQAFSVTSPIEPPEARAGLLYTNRLDFDHAELVELFLWTPREWKARVKERLPFEIHCTKTRGVDLAGGHAVIYAGRRPGGRCGEHGPKNFAAIASFPGVVITAERTDTCEDCRGHVDRPYNSFKGIATIVRGLQLRPQPVS